MECTEHQFFYDRMTGGTDTIGALTLLKDIINKDYIDDKVNLYVAWCADGDDFDPEPPIHKIIREDILPKVQYMAYLQVQDMYDYKEFRDGYEKLYGTLNQMPEIGKKLNIETALGSEDIYPVLYNLFKKRGV